MLAVRLVCYRGNEHFSSEIVLVPKYRITSFIRVNKKYKFYVNQDVIFRWVH